MRSAALRRPLSTSRRPLSTLRPPILQGAAPQLPYVTKAAPERLARALEAERRLLGCVGRGVRVATHAPEIAIPSIVPEGPVHISTVEVAPREPADGGGGGPVVVAHGFGAAKGVFFRNLEALALRTRRWVLAFDWLGQGCSSRPAGFPTRPTPLDRVRKKDAVVDDTEVIDDAIRWFTASLDAWVQRVLPEGEPITLVAHSVGGFLSAHYAMAHPGNVDKLVLVSPAGLPRHPDLVPAADVDALLGANPRPRYECFKMGAPLVACWDWHVTPQALIRLLGDQSALSRPVVKHLYRRVQFPQLDDFADYMYNVNALPGSSEYSLTTLFRPADRKDALRGIYARAALVDDARVASLPPTSVLYGERDWMLNPLTEAAVATLGADLVLVPDAGHQIHLENPDGFNDAVFDAIAAPLPPPQAADLEGA